MMQPAYPDFCLHCRGYLEPHAGIWHVRDGVAGLLCYECAAVLQDEISDRLNRIRDRIGSIDEQTAL